MEVKWRHTVSLNDCGNIQLYGGAYLLWKNRNSILQTKCARHSRSQLSHYAETIPDKKLSIMILILSSQAQHYGCILRSLWVNYSNDDIICRIVWFSLSICAHLTAKYSIYEPILVILNEKKKNGIGIIWLFLMNIEVTFCIPY